MSFAHTESKSGTHHDSNKWLSLFGTKNGPANIFFKHCTFTDLLVLKQLSKAQKKSIQDEINLRILSNLIKFAFAEEVQKKVYEYKCVTQLKLKDEVFAEKHAEKNEYQYPTPDKLNRVLNDKALSLEQRIDKFLELLSVPLQVDLHHIAKQKQIKLLLAKPYCLLFTPEICHSPLLNPFLRRKLYEVSSYIRQHIQQRILKFCQQVNEDNIDEIINEIKYLSLFYNNFPIKFRQQLVLFRKNDNLFVDLIDTTSLYKLWESYDKTTKISAPTDEILIHLLELGFLTLDWYRTINLGVAIDVGSLALLKFLLAKNKNNIAAEFVISLYDTQYTPLMHAAYKGDTDMMEEILQYVDVNFRSGKGWTALMFAAAAGQDKCVEKLVKEYNANITLTNINDQTVYDIAISYSKGKENFQKIIKFLQPLHPSFQKLTRLQRATQKCKSIGHYLGW